MMEKYRYLSILSSIDKYRYFSLVLIFISIPITTQYSNEICEKFYEIQMNFIVNENILKLIWDMYKINTYLFEGQEIRKEVFTNSKDYLFV